MLDINLVSEKLPNSALVGTADYVNVPWRGTARVLTVVESDVFYIFDNGMKLTFKPHTHPGLSVGQEISWDYKGGDGLWVFWNDGNRDRSAFLRGYFDGMESGFHGHFDSWEFTEP